MSRVEAQMVQRQAPPSYGQLIARGVIPPVDGFPTEHPHQVRSPNTLLLFRRPQLPLVRVPPSPCRFPFEDMLVGRSDTRFSKSS